MIYRILIMGPQGSGKGTQSRLLAKKLKIISISMGDILRQEIKEKTKIGRMIEPYLKSGELIMPEINNKLVIGRLRKKDAIKGFALDGYPRTLEQAKFIDKKIKFTHVIDVSISDPEAVRRLSGRITCRKCGAVYHIKYNPPKKKNICDECGGELFVREDDYFKAIKERLKIYHQQTLPVLKHYKKQGILFDIDGEQSIEAVHNDILKIFNL